MRGVIRTGMLGLNLRLAMTAGTTTIVITLTLVAGQFAQLSSLLGDMSWWRWGVLLPSTAIVLLEAILPISALCACAISYGFWRSQGIHITYQGSGRSPIGLLGPALILGLAFTFFTYALGHHLGPTHVKSLRQGVETVWIGQIKDGGLQLSDGKWVFFRDVDGNAYWFAFASEGAEPPILGRSDTVDVKWDDEGPLVRVSNVDVWGTEIRLSSDTLLLRLDSRHVDEKLRMLGPPNALVSSELDLADTHQRFTYFRRHSMSSITLIWSVFGALLGLSFGPLIGILGASGLVAVSYWILRAGELAARHGHYPAVLAAWGPAVFSMLMLVALFWFWRRRMGRGVRQ